MNHANHRFFLAGIIVIIVCFAFIGCSQIYRAVGLDEKQVTELVGEDQVKTVVIIKEVKGIFWQLVSAGVAGVGGLTAAVLAKWLQTERRMTNAVIIGVENSGVPNVKNSIRSQASMDKIENQLHKRVVKLT